MQQKQMNVEANKKAKKATKTQWTTEGEHMYY